jgi:hypothetical protein
VTREDLRRVLELVAEIIREDYPCDSVEVADDIAEFIFNAEHQIYMALFSCIKNAE